MMETKREKKRVRQTDPLCLNSAPLSPEEQEGGRASGRAVERAEDWKEENRRENEGREQTKKRD